MASIDNAFRELVLEKAYDRISVSELCERACINKKTFYAHFRSLDDLLREKLEQITQGFIGRIAGFALPEQLHAIHREFFLYSIEQGEFYEKLVCSAAYRHIGSELLGKFVRTAWKDSRWFNTLDDETQSMVLSYLHSAGTALYRQWVEDGKRMSPEKAISVGGILLCKGVEGIFQAG